MTFFRHLCLVVALGLAIAANAAGDNRASLLSRPEMQTPAPTGRIVLKLDPAAGLTMDDAGLAGRADDATKLQQRISALVPGARLERRIGLSAAATRAFAQRAAAYSGSPAPDLNLWAQFDAGTRDVRRLAALAAALAADPAVITAFAEPVAVPAAIGFDAFTGATPSMQTETTTKAPDPALPTPDYTSQQGYLGAAPAGVGAVAVSLRPGARGDGVKICDVEGAWLWTHEDLTAPFFTSGVPMADLDWRNHGTAVMGEMRGSENGFGVRGIVPAASIGGSSIGSQSTASALANAAAALAPGDLILIELHAPGPNANGSGQYGYVAMEYWQDNYDVISLATATGIVVCEAAGNGEQDLDQAVYQGLFDRNVRDSGAILIGATEAGTLTPAWFTNYGTRVDCNGWGSNVVTTAYGDLQSGPETQWYTGYFSGTSSASPIVTGSAASLQGMIDAWYGLRVDGRLVRHILSTTGTPVADPRLIGSRPNLVAAWDLASHGISQVSGAVTEQGTGRPLSGVTISASPTGATAVTDAAGRYQMVLLAGTYNLTFHDAFHETVVASVVVGSQPVTRDVVLPLLPLVTVGGRVTTADGTPLANVVIRTAGAPVGEVVTAADGTFTVGSIPATRILTITAGGKPGYGGAARTVTVPSGPSSLRVDFVLAPATYTFEAGPQGFTATSLWQRGIPPAGGSGPQQAFDGSYCWGIGMDGSGYDDQTTGTLVGPSFSASQFAGYQNLYLSFHLWLGTEAGFDGVQVETANGTLLQPIGGYSDQSLAGLDYEPGWAGEWHGWRPVVFDVSAYIGQPWQFRLVFGSDQSVTGPGVFVDGFTLAEQPSISTPVQDEVPVARAGSLRAQPNPFNPRTVIAWSLARASRIDLQVYDPRGRLVADLLNDEPVAASGNVAWNGQERSGRPAAAGVYLVRLRTDDGAVLSHRVVLAK